MFHWLAKVAYMEIFALGYFRLLSILVELEFLLDAVLSCVKTFVPWSCLQVVCLHMQVLLQYVELFAL